LLLERGGRTVYFGEIGADAHVVRGYFTRYGAHCPANVNPAEFMLDAIGAGIAPRIGDHDWADIWLNSPEYLIVREEIKVSKEVGLSRQSDRSETQACEWHFILYKWI
jgi:ATP-binding cassette, subfamily G (WHITE), member 2, SNQ2